METKINEVISRFAAKSGFLKILIAVIAGVFIIGIFSGFLLSSATSSVQSSNTFSNVGTLKGIGVGVYWDPGLTSKTTTINWGLLDASAQRSLTFYMRNEGNTAITLTMLTSNWNPSTASSYMTLTWDYNGQTINAGATIQVTFTLTINGAVTGISNFGFDITIIGTG